MAKSAEVRANAQLDSKSVLLVGASRGLGLGLAKSYAAHGWNVVATERRSGASLAAAAEASKGRIRIARVDINDAEAVRSLHQQLSGEAFDLIFIVAGISDKDPTRPVHEVSPQEASEVFMTNAYSPMRFAEQFFDRLKAHGTLAIMTSRMGSLALVSTASDGSWEVYRASKAALNMLARCFHQRHQDQRHGILLLHPGWVKTDMGGPNAPVELAESVEGLYSTVGKWLGSGELVFADYKANPLPW